MLRSFDGKTPSIAASAYVSEAAHVIGDVEIGEGSMVMPGAGIRADMGSIWIGSRVIVEDNCVIHSGSPRSALGNGRCSVSAWMCEMRAWRRVSLNRDSRGDAVVVDGKVVHAGGIPGPDKVRAWVTD